MKKITVLLCILARAMAAYSQQQVQANDELKSLITQSFSYFPKVREAENNIAIAQDKLAIAEINNPTVDGLASYRFVQPKVTIPIQSGSEVKDFQFFPVNNVNAEIDANYLVFDFGKLKANVEKAKTELKYAEHNVDYIKNQLANQVATIYYNIVYLQKGMAIEDSVIAFLDENKRVISSKLANGDALKIDLLNVQVNIDAEQNRRLDLKNSLDKQLNLLAYTTGLTSIKGLKFDFDVALHDAVSALSAAQTNNLEYVLARDRIQQAQQDLNIVQSANKPNLLLGANAGFKNGYVPNVNAVRFNYAAGVTFKIPIYDGGKVKQQTKLSESIIKQNQLSVQTLDNTFTKDIQQALTDINSNIERIKNTEGQIEQARIAEELSSSRFKNGAGTNLEITDASSNRKRAEFTRLQYEYQLCVAKIELAKLLGYQYW
ncbi:MAG TPA: TolC family protein [Panacibacter sp.]|nr:TolC family protein [Panacibacter sp.]HNP46737.1 TolC family protein [Panacibacter sp.]